ncbi:MAG TPA: hypothetical protein VN915_09940 [Elusimicrobiota bacterium]|nr:hypothetical protein [Elusimicrobiota bacterium]
MKRPALFLALAVLAACRKPATPAPDADAVPTRAVVAGVALIDYDAATGEFSCRAPGRWKALEDDKLGPRVMFFGPGSAKYPRSVSISVMRYPNGEPIKTPRDLFDALKLSGQNPSPLESRAANGRTEYSLHYDAAQRPLHGYKTLYMKRDDVVMIPFKDGFFAIEHSAPVETYAETLPVFAAVVASFQPKG